MAVLPTASGCLCTALLLLAALGYASVRSYDAEDVQADGRQQELEVVGRILSVFAKQEKDPCIPRGRILAIIQTAKPRYNATLSVIMVFLSNLVLAFNVFVMVATRYLRFDIRNSIVKIFQETADS
ncbi:hypothetical protein HPB47_005483 [Ixodes persulcatus]|uniref:Uncharacterized protein n=1 Tax=Ixodes persulcatus TaxID=34615 RepID=A0AC60PD90_IXOPE|nr:hypothetical protein HPB47_005483 [Ixodes persulcatus]